MEPFPKYPCQGRYKESGEVDKMDEVDEEEDGKIFLTLVPELQAEILSYFIFIIPWITFDCLSLLSQINPTFSRTFQPLLF
ncbi:hypothetical protein C8J57DRAFT_1518078 [Mycena rebaudengoi]|nr:hypothetical protein C8J57DRAFT_1518078 [Mycena rebaudengoi]